MTSLSMLTANLAQFQPGGNWFWQAMTSRLSILCGLVLLLSIPAALICLRAMYRMGRAAASNRTRKSVLRGEEGTAMIEFMLVLPFAMFFIFMVAQTTFLMTGNIMVHYAAFSACRSAIVQVPAQPVFHSDEPQNYIILSRDGRKFEAVRRAAVFALYPVSGPLDNNAQIGEDVSSAIGQVYGNFGQDVPEWVNNVIGQRVNYADANTDLQFFEALPDGNNVELNRLTGAHKYGPKETIAVQVTHRFYLSVPWVGFVYMDGMLDSSQGEGPYTEVTAHYALPNEGIDVLLPPKPPIDRIP